MLGRLWPLLLRIAVGMYFIYPNLMKFTLGLDDLSNSLFGCIDKYIPVTIAFSVYYGFFIIVGALVIALIRSIFPLAIALVVLSIQLYINFTMQSYTPLSMLLFILILVTLSLIMYTSGNRWNTR